MKSKIGFIIIAIAILIAIVGCNEKKTDEVQVEKPYSKVLEEKLEKELSNESAISERPDYLPEVMFSRLPGFPDDFYNIRTLIHFGKLKDLGELSEEYWMQPEFFPKFEETGLKLLQNPPENRWGAYGILVYPADSVSTIIPGETLDLYFFVKSSYLVETYQGINFEVGFPSEASIESGSEMPDGSKKVQQDSAETKKYFDVKLSMNPFILDPNFPIYNINGTRKIKVSITALEDTPPGNYIVSLDTSEVPEEYELKWLEKYLNLYTSGGMTKIDRPYYQAFIEVKTK